MRDSMWTYILKVHLLSVSLPSARFKEGKVFGLEMKCFALLKIDQHQRRTAESEGGVFTSIILGSGGEKKILIIFG